MENLRLVDHLTARNFCVTFITSCVPITATIFIVILAAIDVPTVRIAIGVSVLAATIVAIPVPVAILVVVAILVLPTVSAIRGISIACCISSVPVRTAAITTAGSSNCEAR